MIHFIDVIIITVIAALLIFACKLARSRRENGCCSSGSLCGCNCPECNDCGRSQRFGLKKKPKKDTQRGKPSPRSSRNASSATPSAGFNRQPATPAETPVF